MKNSKKIMRIGMVVLIITFIGCVGFTYYIRLENPVFLKNCIEMEAAASKSQLSDQLPLELKYITNTTDKRSVTGISFLEEPNLSFTATEHLLNNSMIFYESSEESTLGERYGRYTVRTVYVYMDNNYKEQWEGEKELCTASIVFDNGDSMTTDIGRIVIYSDKENREVLTSLTSESSSNGSASTVFTVEEDITLHKLESVLLDSASEILKLKVEDKNYHEIAGLKCNKGSKLKVSSNVPDMLDKGSSYDVYNISPKLYYEKQDKSTGFIRINNINTKLNFFGFKDVLKYLQQRGAV